MKNYIRVAIFCLVSLFSLQSYGQYQSIFGDSLTSWKSVTSQLFGSFIDSVYDSGKDTLFGSDTFRIIEGQDITGKAEFYLLEDTTSGIVYYRSSDINDTNRYKIMDLSLSKGDTMFFEPTYWFKVDSVSIKNGRKHLKLDSTAYDLTMIEGVGTTGGIDFLWLNGLRNLICVKKNDTIYYEDSSLANYNCNSTVTGINDDSDKTTKIIIFPNPAKDYISLNISGDSKIKKVEIYSINGQLKMTVKSNFQQMSLGDLPDNLYLIKVYSDDGVLHQKIVIQSP